MINKERYGNILRISGYISGLFTLFVAVLMILGYLQLESIKPLENPSLELLKEQYDASPNNDDLKQQVRALDLMARRAFFASRWQIETGTWLLIIGASVFFISQRLLISNRKRLLDRPENEFDLLGKSKRARIYLGTSSVIVIALAFIISFSIRKNIPDPLPVEKVLVSEGINQTIMIERGTPPATTEKVDQIAVQTIDPVINNSGSDEETVIDKKDEAVPEPVKSKSESSSNFPFFRGEGSRGFAPQGTYPTSWNGKTGENIKWKIKVPHHGYSSPSIWDNKIFLTGADGGSTYVMCFDKNTGELLWNQNANGVEGEPETPPKTSEDTGLAAPTTANNSGVVCAIFANGNLVTFDHDGNRLWAKNLGVPDNHYGHSSSLIIHSDILIVQYDHFKSKSVMAFDVLNGNKLWETVRPVAISWASPVIAEFNGQVQVILSSEPKVISYNIQNGKELWSAQCMSGEVGPSVGVNSKYVFAVNDFAVLAAIDPSQDGKVLWEDNEYTPEVASPVATEDFVYILTTWGGTACYETNTGELVWDHDFDYGFYSSPMIANDNVYMLDQAGVMHIVKTDREFTLVGECELGERANSTPAFSDGRIYLRTDEHLYCIGE